MLKNLIKAPSRLAMLQSKQVARMSELKEYVCLRESLNDQAASKAAQDFQNLASKYNLSPEDLTALFKVINNDPELLKQHVSYEAWLQDYETLKFTWRRTPFFSSGQSLQNTVQSLRSKYPDVVNFEAGQPERVQAYHTLENIFVRDGPTLKSSYDNASVSRFLPEFEKRINGHINELRNKAQNKPVDPHGVHASAVNVGEGDTVTEIARSLGSVYAKLKRDPAYVYGNIRHFIALHKQNLGELEPRQAAQPRQFKSLEERSVAVTRGEVDPLELGDDLPAILAEENKEIKKGLGYNFLPWLNDRKVIFEAQADRGNTLLYGALAGVFGSVLLWKIYQGDATFTNLAVVAAATAFCFGRYRIASIRNNFDYLVQMNIHRDGKTLDLFIQKANNQVSKIEGVPVSDFKIIRNDYEFDFGAQPEPSEDIKESREGRLGVRLSDLRRFGAGRGSWIATYGQDYLLVPMIHEGNHAVLQQVFKGQNVEAST